MTLKTILIFIFKINGKVEIFMSRLLKAYIILWSFMSQLLQNP